MNKTDYFKQWHSPVQKRYEALRAFYFEKVTLDEITKRFNFKASYFRKLCSEFSQSLDAGIDPFFTIKKTGPKTRQTSSSFIEKIVAMRKRNLSIMEIRAALSEDISPPSLNTIDKILKDEGFAPLPKRTHSEREMATISEKIQPPRSQPFKNQSQTLTTEIAGGCLIFLPLIEELGIINAIKESNFPQTSQLSDVQMLLSFLSLKLLGNKRLSHDSLWNLDYALGFFSGLNVLPKSSTLSSYSYRVSRESNYAFLKAIGNIFTVDGDDEGVFNLDFKAIPHWGDESILEKHWCGARGKAMKSILSLIVQNPTSGLISYTNADIQSENDCVLEFVDFWKEGKGQSPKMLIFDSKFTTYSHLNKLNQDDIKFITLRRRGKKLIDQVDHISDEQWQTLYIERTKGKKQKVSLYDHLCTLRNYQGQVREIIIKDHGRDKPVFFITNDLTSDAKKIIRNYAKRWLIEKEIAEQVEFFHLNSPSSSIVVKVDFDLTLSVLAHNLYRYAANYLTGFENCNAETLNRKFFQNGAKISIKDGVASVALKKKSHLPILMQLPWMSKQTSLSWMEGMAIEFISATAS